MTLQQLLNRPVTITRRTGGTTEDPYGNQLDDTVTVATVGELQQQQRLETESSWSERAGEVLQSTWLLVLPANTAVDGGDKVTVDGQDFEVQGTPWHARNPRTGEAHHVEATLRRTGGVDEDTGS